MIKYFSKNTIGTDYAIGDIHGCLTLLRNALKRISFDTTKDRLFCVGDLIDRGPESNEMIEFAKENDNWFQSIQGNHEKFVLSWKQNADIDVWRNNGGGWFFSLSQEDQEKIFEFVKEMPALIEIETDSLPIGISHANIVNNSWQYTKDIIDDERIRHYLAWSRGRKPEINTSLKREDVSDKGIRYKHCISATGIPDVSLLVLGHNIFNEPVIEGNIYHIDTGAFYTNTLTILNLNTRQFV